MIGWASISFAGNQCDFHVTLSAGVASSQGRTTNELMEMADRALYTAKNNGRNQVRLATEEADA